MLKYDLHDILAAIEWHKRKYQGDGPTIRELMELTGIPSTSTMKRYLEKMADKGMILVLEYNRIVLPGAEWKLEYAKGTDAYYRLLKELSDGEPKGT